MKKHFSVAVAGLFLTAMLFAAQSGQAEKAVPTGRTLKVKMHYSGTGAVDEKHKIFVFLFNSVDFMQGDGQPIATRTAATKDETLTFPDLADSPVYLAVVLDPSGNYDGQSQPPAGSSTAIYAKEPNVPDPIVIEPGKTAEIPMSFDDTHKMR